MENQNLKKIARQLENLQRQLAMVVEVVNALAAAEKGGKEDGPREGREVSLSVGGREYKI